MAFDSIAQALQAKAYAQFETAKDLGRYLDLTGRVPRYTSVNGKVISWQVTYEVRIYKAWTEAGGLAEDLAKLLMAIALLPGILPDTISTAYAQTENRRVSITSFDIVEDANA